MKFKKGDLVIAYVPFLPHSRPKNYERCVCKILDVTDIPFNPLFITSLSVYCPVYRSIDEVTPFFNCKLSKLVYNVED